MSKIKVAHIITILELGGAQGNTLYTCENLNRDKFDVFLVCGRGGILDEKTRSLKTYFVKELIREVCPLYDLLALIKIYRILKKEKPRIVHTHSSKAGILGRWAAWFNNLISHYILRVSHRIKIIHTFHGFGFNKYQKSPVRVFFTFLEKITARISDVLIFVSESNLNEAKLKRIGDPRDYLLIRSGIDIDFYRSITVDIERKKREFGIKSDEKVITTIGPFKKQKNLSDFLVVASLLKSRGVKVKFLVVGDGEEREKLKTLTKKLDLENEVFFLGWIKQKSELAEILKITDVFVMTSLWEGLPRSILEAIASGVAVCANAVDGVRDVIKDGETGFLSQPFDVSKMASNIDILLSDPELRSKMIKNAGKLLERSQRCFDINYMVRQQEELYQRLISKRSEVRG